MPPLPPLTLPQPPLDMASALIQQTIRSLEWWFGPIIPRPLLTTARTVLEAVVLERLRAADKRGKLPHETTIMSSEANISMGPNSEATRG